jgi:hypothetical protein
MRPGTVTLEAGVSQRVSQAQRPQRRQDWLRGLPWLAGLQVHWMTAAWAAVETPLTSTHLPLCRATSW